MFTTALRLAPGLLVAGLVAGCASSPDASLRPMAAHGGMSSTSRDAMTTSAVEYDLELIPTWTAASHPLDYPPDGLLTGPHFSGLIGVTHRPGFRLFTDGGPPSRGLERLSEEGKHAPLDEELRAAIARGEAGQLVETDPVKDLTTRARARVTVDAAHPRFSGVAMIAPSPDWFLAAVDVSLLEGDRWTERREVTLFAWDAGGDDGATYLADDRDTSPKKAARLNDAPHFVRGGQRVPVATLVLTRR